MNQSAIFSKYYLATPVFGGLYFVTEVNLRISLPWDGNHLTYIYMAVCFVLGGLLIKKPLLLRVFTIFECSVNLLFLALSVYIPIVTVASDLENSEPIGLSIIGVIQFCLVACILLYGFYGNLHIKKNT